MNAPSFDHRLKQGSEFVRGSATRATDWGQRTLPGGAKTLWILVGLVLVALLVWFLKPAPTTTQGRNGFGAGGPVPVGVARATAGDITVTLDALGTVTPLATVTVKPQVSGILDKINFQEGQMVKAGDVLAEIDPRPYQAAVDQAKGQQQRDEAQLANAKIDLARYQSLSNQNAIAQQTLATQAALVRTDEGTVKADQAAVAAANVNLSYCTITSPVAGRVGIRQVDIGNLMQAGVTSAIVVVTQLQPISVLFTLPEDDLSAVSTQLSAGSKLAADAYDRARTAKLAAGSLATFDNEVDPTTGTVKMRAMFDNADNRLFPQQFVNVRLTVNTLHNQTTVPVAAIQRGADGSFVYVVGKDKSVSVRTVNTGPTDSGKVDITSGLRPGETVVVDGADRLKDGAHVSIPNANWALRGGQATAGHGAGAHGHHRRRHAQGGDESGGGP